MKMKTHGTVSLAGLFCVLSIVSHCLARSDTSGMIDLRGTWRFAMDAEDVGTNQGWYERDLGNRIQLPGVLQSQGYGNRVSAETPWVLSLYDHYWYERKEYKAYAPAENIKVPFLCQPKRHYLGVAWYQRDIVIPENWENRRVILMLERTRWKSTVWVDGRQVGSRDSLVAPHRFDLSGIATGAHTLSIRVDNRMQMDYRPDAHSVSDSLGSTWNGIVGKIQLVSSTAVWIDQVRAFPDIDNRSVNLDVSIGNRSSRAGKGQLKVKDVTVPVSWDSEGGRESIVIQCDPNTPLWSEFNSSLQHLTVYLSGEQADDAYDVAFGFREIGTDGHDLLINGTKAHFRGTHSGGDFPMTGYPAMDVDYWRRLFATCKSWRINHVRFHSFCPPEAAFTAADEMGIYLQPECGMWNVISPDTPMEKRMYEETDAMLREYGNHPSFALFSPSNEPKGHWKDSLPRWVEHYRKEDPRRLYTTGTGWPLIDVPGHVEGADYLAVHRIGSRPVRGNQAWFGRDYLRSMREVDVPIIVHELGQWCAYPDFDVIDKFTGYMRPGNFEIYRESMAEAGLLDRDKVFAMASGRFQAACYKEEIEANLRTPGLAGFQLLDLHDYVGQGTALVGVLDAFWEEKGYIDAKQWRRFCNTTVPLALMQQRVFTPEDAFDVEVKIAHYGQSPMNDIEVYWRIEGRQGRVFQSGTWPVKHLPLGSAIPLGRVQADLSNLLAPGAYKLVVGVSNTAFENDWDFWLYPSEGSMQVPSVKVSRSFDETLEALGKGETVLFMPLHTRLRWDCPPVGRRPIFWNCMMGPNWERFLGLVCDAGHPALACFPTESCYDWQWEDVFHPYCRAINMDTLPRQVQPIVQMIDDWNRNYKLGALFECRVDKGRLMVCAADLESDLDKRPAARQMRDSIVKYMASDAFDPSVRMTEKELLSLRFDNLIMQKLGAVVVVPRQGRGGGASNAIDGNPNTFWASPGQSRQNYPPHELVIRFPEPAEVSGLVIVNRQNHREHEGDIRDYEIMGSDDGQEWAMIKRGQLESTFDPQYITFGQHVSVRHLKIRALSGFGKDTSASLAEAAVVYEGPQLSEEDIERNAAYRNVSTATEEIYQPTNILEYSTNPTARQIEQVTADSESLTDQAGFAFDGDPATIWHTQWRSATPAHPHWLKVEFKKTVSIKGIRYLPRQDRQNGWIKDYCIDVSMDGVNWQSIAKGQFKAVRDVQTVTFDRVVEAKYLKLIAISEALRQPFASVAELTIIEGP